MTVQLVKAALSNGRHLIKGVDIRFMLKENEFAMLGERCK
jgi:hypothetical protein